MKIAYLHSGKFPSKTPSMTFVLFNSLGLATSFEEVFLFLKNNSPHPTENILIEEYGIVKPNNLNIIRIKISPLIRSSFIYNLILFVKVINILKSRNIQAVVTRYIKFLPWLYRLKKYSKVKVFFESHDFYSRSLVDMNNKSKNSSFGKMEKKYIPKIDGVFCLQKTQIEVYKKIFPNYDRFFLVRTGINNINRVEFNDRKFITYIGSFDRHKGVENLLEVYSKMNTKLKLVLIGGKSEDEINKIISLANKYNIEDKIVVTGWINKKALNNYLAKTIIGVLPLEPTFFNKYLTSPLKLFDYFSFGCPILASDLPTLRELIQENEMGLFYDSTSKEDMLNKLSIMLHGNELLKKMSSNIYSKAEEYLWNKRGEKIKLIIMESMHE